MFSFWKDDLSYQKTATQSMTYPGSETMYGAGNAVDRKSLTCMRTLGVGRSYPEKTVLWKVDFGGLYSITTSTLSLKITTALVSVLCSLNVLKSIILF